MSWRAFMAAARSGPCCGRSSKAHGAWYARKKAPGGGAVVGDRRGEQRGTPQPTDLPAKLSGAREVPQELTVSDRTCPLGRGQRILDIRKEIKRRTIDQRRR